MAQSTASGTVPPSEDTIRGIADSIVRQLNESVGAARARDSR